jgi:hypothetical protein
VKLTLVVSSAAYLSSAGTRIRYRRMMLPLERAGCDVALRPIEESTERDVRDTDILLFSKCQDARALAMAHSARTAGALVGVDLFDDYFSQRTDVRFATQRHWLRRMAAEVDFFLCSTPRMKDVVQACFGNAPGHVLNDPYGSFDPAHLAAQLERKREEAMRTRTISVLWFGIGDNPNFPVGLYDLASNGEALRGLAATGFATRLMILTNERALDAEGLMQLRRLDVPFAVHEWSEEAEAEALGRHLVSFLPVNSQPFSIAKSLNRGVSSLTGGTQILSAGYPLYAPLGEFVYRDPAALVSDLEVGELRLTAATLDRLSASLQNLCDPDREARGLLQFLQVNFGELLARKRRPSAGSAARDIAILHGSRSTAGIHRFAERRGWLSLATPFTPPGISYDAHLGFFGAERSPALRLSKRACERLASAFRGKVFPASASTIKAPPLEIPLSEVGLRFSMYRLQHLANRSGGDQLSLYRLVQSEAHRLYRTLFGDIQIVDSELDSDLNAGASADFAGWGVAP